MRFSLAKISNDIVSLTVMALMSVAFIAAQAAPAGSTELAEPTLSEVVGEIEGVQVLVIDIDISLRSIGE